MAPAPRFCGTVYDGRQAVGSIVELKGIYRAFDEGGRLLGEFSTLKAAMAAVGQAR